jgi:hypothetical protein
VKPSKQDLDKLKGFWSIEKYSRLIKIRLS